MLAAHGAGRGERQVNKSGVLIQSEVLFVAAVSFSAVEGDGFDLGMFAQQGLQVVRLFLFDGRIEAAFTVTGVDDIPKGDMMLFQKRKAILVGDRILFL